MQWSDYQIICTRTSSDKIWLSLPKNMLRNIALHHLANVDSHHVYITNLLFTDINIPPTHNIHIICRLDSNFFLKQRQKSAFFSIFYLYTPEINFYCLNLFPQEDFILETEKICYK